MQVTKLNDTGAITPCQSVQPVLSFLMLFVTENVFFLLFRLYQLMTLKASLTPCSLERDSGLVHQVQCSTLAVEALRKAGVLWLERPLIWFPLFLLQNKSLIVDGILCRKP